MSETSLDQLKKYTTVVADTGEFELIQQYKPQDATTNPSLVLAAFSKPDYTRLTEDALAYAKAHGGHDLEDQVHAAADRLAVNFGAEILKVVPGRVSTELDARMSFNTAATIKKAHVIAELYRSLGVDVSKRVLFKIAATWEGLQAAKVLEAEGLHCNLTLLFALPQAVVAADNGVTLISPFAGRITDYYKARDGRKDNYPPTEDPGVVSVTRIFEYYKKFGLKTQVMGASFRTMEQVIELAGCDLLTISPALLDQLSKSNVPVTRKLNPDTKADVAHISSDENTFRWLMNEDEMATAKLAEGIRRFAADTVKLEAEIRKKLTA